MDAEIIMKNRSSTVGFTLVEVLVATTILSLMLLFLFSIFDQSTKAWQAGERKVDAFREARAGLYMLRRDLRGALVEPETPMAFNQLESPIPFSGVLAPSNVGSNLLFLTTLPLNAQGGGNVSELCAVGYYMAWMRSAVGADEAPSFSFNLVRYFNPSGSPQSTGGTVANLISFITGGSGDINLLFPRVGSSVQPENEVLARNVVRFEVVPYAVNGSGTLTAVPAGVIDEIPQLIEITLDVINTATAAKLGDAPANWNPLSSPRLTLLNENKQSFRTRVSLKP
jgi:prepilin-type N-terminal cleavage/methylation domain-containing protein